jgi:hypothetical protein
MTSTPVADLLCFVAGGLLLGVAFGAAAGFGAVFIALVLWKP